MVFRKAILTDSKIKGGHLGYSSFPVMYEFVIPMTVISVTLHFKRFRLLNSAGTSYYKNVITCSELQVGRTSSDVWGIARRLHPVIRATIICSIQCHKKSLRLLRYLNDGAHANTHADTRARARAHTHTHTHTHTEFTSSVLQMKHLHLYTEWTYGLRMLQISTAWKQNKLKDK